MEFVIRDAFTRAKAYRKDWQDYEAKKKAGQDVLAPRRDLQLDALVEILEGKRLVHAHSYRADEILMLIRLADEMGFKITTFQHVLEGYKVAKEIAAHNAGASTFSDWWGYKMEAADAIPHNASLMTHKGVLVSINSDDAELARRLNMEAAKAIRYGDVTEEQAFAMVTINPAKQLKIDNRVGSIEVGKDADLVVWNHHPLSTAAIVERTYIDGIAYYDREKDLQRIADIQKEKGGRQTTERLPPPAPTERPTDDQRRAGRDQRRAGGAPAGRPGRTLRVKANATGAAWAITNARIVTVSGPVIPKGTIVIKGNRIEAVGANVSMPSGVKPVDAGGATVIPGIIDASTDIGLNEPGVRNYDDVSEILPFDQMLRTRVAYRADSLAIPVTRTEGVTTVAVRPGGGTISGEMPVMNLDGWTWEEATAASVGRPGAELPRRGGWTRRWRRWRRTRRRGADRPRSDEDVEPVARSRPRLRQGAGGQPPGRLDARAVPAGAERRQALFVTATTEAAIRDAVAWAEKQQVRIVLQTGADAQRVAGFLKQHDVPVILTSVLSLPPREDEFHAYPYQTAGVLEKAGVTFAFSSGGFQFSRNVPFQAARAVAWGLSHEARSRR